MLLSLLGGALLDKTVREKNGGKSNTGNAPEWRQLACFSVFQFVTFSYNSIPRRYPRPSRGGYL